MSSTADDYKRDVIHTAIKVCQRRFESGNYLSTCLDWLELDINRVLDGEIYEPLDQARSGKRNNKS